MVKNKEKQKRNMLEEGEKVKIRKKSAKTERCRTWWMTCGGWNKDQETERNEK